MREVQSEPFELEGALPPELAQLEEEYLAIEEAVLDLADGLSHEQLRWRPNAGGWSILECLDHLNVAGLELLPRADRAVADGERRGLRRQGPFRPRWRGRFSIRWMEPPPRMKVPAPKIFRPQWPSDSQRVVREVAELQGELIKRLHDMRALDLSKLIIASPASRWVRLSLGEWMMVTAAHERRHLWQAQRVRETEDFPLS